MGKNSKSVQNKKNARERKREKTLNLVNFNKSKQAHNVKSDLNSLLQSIYNDTIDLRTTCNHSCDCCNVSCPSMNKCEFLNIIVDLWPKLTNKNKIDLISKSIEYFFKTDYEKFQKEIFIKPCMLLDSKGLCSVYDRRSLNCRTYGLWPKDSYEKRVDKFEKAYSKYGIKREDLPLNTQCPNVKRINDAIPLTQEIIDGLYRSIDKVDETIGEFSPLQIAQKENYRTFQDWLLFSIIGIEWLSKLSVMSMAADKTVLEDQISAFKTAIENSFKNKDVPNIVFCPRD